MVDSGIRLGMEPGIPCNGGSFHILQDSLKLTLSQCSNLMEKRRTAVGVIIKVEFIVGSS